MCENRNIRIMEMKMCYRYVEFLYKECKKYLKDNEVTENEIHQLKLEFDRFIKRVDDSELPKDIKKKIKSIKLDYNLHEKNEYMELLGRWDITKGIRRRKLKKKLESFKDEIKAIMYLLD